MRTRRLDFNWKPLQVDMSLSVSGSVPDRQSYNADANEFVPDYTKTPVVIQPIVGIIDKDGYILSGSANKDMANVAWYVLEGNGSRTVISQSNPDFSVTYSGDEAGKLLVRKNASPNFPINLIFHAEYVDRRNSQTHVWEKPYQIRCNNSTSYVPILHLDVPVQSVWNPIRESNTVDIHASLLLGASECDTSKRIFVWYKQRDDGTWSQIGADDTLDYDISVSSDGVTATLNRSLMGDSISIKCCAKYSASGSPSGVSIYESSPTAYATFVRRIPKYEYDILGMPSNILPDILDVSPSLEVRDNIGIISDVESVFIPMWYIAQGKSSGTLSYQQVALGMNPTIPTRVMHAEYGAVIAVDLKDGGARKAWMTADEAYVFTDASGNVLLI